MCQVMKVHRNIVIPVGKYMLTLGFTITSARKLCVWIGQLCKTLLSDTHSLSISARI